MATPQPALREVGPASTAAPALIEIRNVSKTYVTASGGNVHALDKVDLRIAEGEFVCVVGPSGCGKSTLLRMLAGLDTFDTGRLSLGDRAVTGPSAKVGVVFQATNLLPWLTVRENVVLPLRVGGRHAPADKRVDDLLGIAGLGDFGARYPYELSGGMQQRAGICRALARAPPTLARSGFTSHQVDLADGDQVRRCLRDAGAAMWRLHVDAAALLADCLSPAMPEGGRIVLIGSRTSSGAAGRSQYAATKATLVGMARSWAIELAPRGITVNVIAPAATETPMLHDTARDAVAPRVPPIGRYVRPEEVAALAAVVLSDDAAAITGQQLVICGGSSL